MRTRHPDSLERRAGGRLGWCGAVALAAHAVLAFGALALPRSSEHRVPRTALALVSVELESSTEGALSVAAPPVREQGSAAGGSDPRGASARVRTRRAPLVRGTAAEPVTATAGIVPIASSTAASGPMASDGVPGGFPLSGSSRGRGSGSASASALAGGHAGAHGPRLRVRKPCRGMFPASADNDVGVVTLALQVGQEGAAKGARILDERPRGQGFARAALSCVPRLSFEPATRDDGTRTAATSTVRLRFVRHL